MSRIVIGRRVEAGPQGEHVQALIERLDAMTPNEATALAAAWEASWEDAWNEDQAAARAAAEAAAWAAWDAARGAAFDAAGDAWDAAWDAAWAAAGDAAWAAVGLLVRDLIDTVHYDALTMPVRSVLGPIHPDDPKEV